MSDKERMIKGLFNRLTDLKNQKKYFEKEKDYVEAMRVIGRINSVKCLLKKEMSL